MEENKLTKKDTENYKSRGAYKTGGCLKFNCAFINTIMCNDCIRFSCFITKKESQRLWEELI